MGRGRQKAKQTKVARQLKYFSPDTNYTALQRELHSGGDLPGLHSHARESEEPTAEVDDEEFDEFEEWTPGR